MDGEFDREIDDDGWGPVKGTWKPLETQLNNVMMAAATVVEGKEKEKKMTAIKEKIEKLIKHKGKKLSDVIGCEGSEEGSEVGATAGSVSTVGGGNNPFINDKVRSQGMSPHPQPFEDRTQREREKEIKYWEEKREAEDREAAEKEKEQERQFRERLREYEENRANLKAGGSSPTPVEQGVKSKGKVKMKLKGKLIDGPGKGKGHRAALKAALEGEWTSADEEDWEEEEKIDDWYKRMEDEQEQLIEEIEESLGEMRNIEKTLRAGERNSGRGRRIHPMQTRHGPQVPPRSSMPVVTTGGGPRYKPFGIGDIQAIVDKLPPVAEGGNLWLSKLDSLTAGQKLALGDFRAVIARCLTGSDIRDIET